MDKELQGLPAKLDVEVGVEVDCFKEIIPAQWCYMPLNTKPATLKRHSFGDPQLRSELTIQMLTWLFITIKICK
ncbi:MAG: hypothetical protein WCH46_10145 [bacterium]